MVGGYINVFRIELFQFINHIVHFLYAVPFQGRKYFKWESSRFTAVYQIDDFHILIIFDANVAKILVT